MTKEKVLYECENCGHEQAKWMGKCPECGLFNSFHEKIITKRTDKQQKEKEIEIKTINEISLEHNVMTSCGISEMDRILCGGFAPASFTLLSGEPGIGKSTLMLQLAENLAIQGNCVLYVSGEESLSQIKIRANRLHVASDRLFIMNENNVKTILESATKLSANFLFVDSIQTTYCDENSAQAGAASQIKECTMTLMEFGKSRGIHIILIGHVTKEGLIAGPKLLEHMVDTVLYFEGDKNFNHRMLRVQKNRFGSCEETALFEIKEDGLGEIKNPSEYLLKGRAKHAPGSVIFPSLEGTRVLLAEIQALCQASNFGQARRTINSMDYNRSLLQIAILEKQMKLPLFQYDIYTSIAGGIKIWEPALDCALAAAIYGSFRNIPLSVDWAVFGEIGLSGEIRAVNFAEKRIMEAKKMGFTKICVPFGNQKDCQEISNVEIHFAENVSDMVKTLFTCI